MKRFFASLLICVAIITVGTVVAVSAMSARSSGQDPLSKTPDKIPNVDVKVLQTRTLEDSFILTGTVAPWESLVISAELSGKIESQGVEEGDGVKAGEEIFHVDTAMAQAVRDQATARHKLTVQEYERQQRLAKGGMSTGQSRDRAEADRDMAAADLRTAEIRLNKSVVKCPIAGVVDEVFKKKGEFVDTGMPVARIVQIQKVKVTVGIPERDIGFFKPGMAVKVTLDAMPNKVFAGKIYRIGTSAETTTHTFITEIEVGNKDRVLKPGMVARATLVRKTFPNSIVVPLFSVITLDKKRFVFVEDHGVAHIRPVEVGIIQGGGVQVTGGLSAGDRLIVVGQRDARDGESVKVQKVME